MQVKRISDIIIGKDQPRYNDLWLDTSEGESKSVLKYKGNSIVGSGNGQSDPGYSITKSYITVDEETVTMIEDNGDYIAILEGLDSLVPGETYKVTLNNVEYECTVRKGEGDKLELGAPYDENINNFDFSEYPFNINNDIYPWGIITPEEGTYTVKIEEVTEEVTTTPEFKQAVESVTGEINASVTDDNGNLWYLMSELLECNFEGAGRSSGDEYVDVKPEGYEDYDFIGKIRANSVNFIMQKEKVLELFNIGDKDLCFHKVSIVHGTYGAEPWYESAVTDLLKVYIGGPTSTDGKWIYLYLD